MSNDEKTPAENEIKREPVNHYSRERRLSRASPMVRAMNEEGTPARRGLARILFGSTSNALLFGCIIMICVVIFLYSRPSQRPPGLVLGGNTLALAVEQEEGINILSIIKTAPGSGEVYLGPVEITVSPALQGAAEAPPAYNHWLTFNPADSEFFLVVLPFDDSAFFVRFRAGDYQLSARVEAVQN